MVQRRAAQSSAEQRRAAQSSAEQRRAAQSSECFGGKLRSSANASAESYVRREHGAGVFLIGSTKPLAASRVGREAIAERAASTAVVEPRLLRG